MSIDSQYPETAEKLNWGALLLTPIWAIVHRKYLITLFSVIPFAGFLVSIYACIYGGHWAWDNRKWETKLQFQESVEKWNTSGIIVTILLVIILYFIN